MKLLAVAFLGLVFAAPSVPADSSSGLDPYRWLEGTWRGIGQGEPGSSATERTIEPFLGGRYLRVSGRSVYPKQEANPNGEIHEQMDIWSFDRARNAVVIRQFDNLGFATTYVLDRDASTGERIVLNAEHLENVPRGWRARYTYTWLPPDGYHELLELDPDGNGFRPYVLNRFLRID